MRRRTIWIIVSVLFVALVIVAAFILRKRAAPEAARLLPEADAYVYLNLRPLRIAGLIGKNPLPIDEPEYAQFMSDTGFQFERDLDEVAFAVHAPPRLADAEPVPGAPQAFRRFSEIFIGRFDTPRAAAYFRRLAKSADRYRQVEVFNIPLEGRTLRVALLGVGVAAASNADGPAAIHYMIDRYKEVALPFGGPPLIRQYYRRVPFGSLFWGITRVGAEGGRAAPLMLPGGFDLFFPSNTVVVGSVRYTSAIQVKAEAFTGSPAEAERVVEQANAFLTIFHGLERSTSPSGADADAKAFFESIKVFPYKSRALFEATVPPGFLKKAFAEGSGREAVPR